MWHWRVESVVPDIYTALSVLPACGGLLLVEEGKIVHGLTERIGINK